MKYYKEYLADRSDILSGINITPFTDIILVLLVVFMIAAPGIVSAGLNVSLPGSSTADTQSPTKLSVSMDKEGRLFLDGSQVDTAALRARIEETALRNANLSVVLNADSAAAHGQVISVLDLIRSSGVKNIYVGTVKK